MTYEYKIQRMKSEFLKNLEKTRGMLTQAREMTGMSPTLYTKLTKEDPEFLEKIMIHREATVDYVESKLLENIDKGKEASILFFLKCQGKNRGYFETMRFDGKMEHTVKQLVINTPDIETKKLMNQTIKLIDKEGKEVKEEPKKKSE